jgi:hypothetical protein
LGPAPVSARPASAGAPPRINFEGGGGGGGGRRNFAFMTPAAPKFNNGLSLRSSSTNPLLSASVGVVRPKVVSPSKRPEGRQHVDASMQPNNHNYRELMFTMHKRQLISHMRVNQLHRTAIAGGKRIHAGDWNMTPEEVR